MRYSFLLAFLSLWMSSSLEAKRAYVSDVLYIPVRTGSSNGHRIIRHIKSGTDVTILSTDEASEYSKVKFTVDDKPIEGFVKTRYLLEEPIAAQKLARLEKRFDELKNNRAPLAKTVDDLKEKVASLEKEKAALEGDRARFEAELAEIRKISAKPVDVFEKNKQLQAEQKALNQRLESLESENQKLATDQRNEGIKLALFAVLGGGLAGFLLPYVKPRGRNQRSIRLH